MSIPNTFETTAEAERLPFKCDEQQLGLKEKMVTRRLIKVCPNSPDMLGGKKTKKKNHTVCHFSQMIDDDDDDDDEHRHT